MRLKMLGKLLAVMLLVLFITYVPLVSCADEAQKAWLRMYASDSTYVGYDPDPWIEDSYVVYSGSTSTSTNITVKNFKGDRDVYQIVLIIATNNTDVIDSIYVNGSSVALSWVDGPDPNGPPMYTDPGPPPENGTYLGDMPAHGIYNDPTARWTEYRSGKNLTAKDTPGDSVLFMMTINLGSPNGNVKLHLDAYGWIYEGSGKKPVIGDDTLDAAFAPFSHDITILIPEFIVASSIAFSLGVCGYLLIKRKFTT